MSITTAVNRLAPPALLAPRPARFDPHEHTAWCARGHRCGLGEHRADPVTLTAPGGAVVLTRVQAPTGRQHAEVRISIKLPTGENNARAHLALILTALQALLRRVT